jgi:HSP20 family protein
VLRDPKLLGLRRLQIGWDEVTAGRAAYAPRGGFTPRVDVYYCGDVEPRAVVRAELPGVDVERVAIEIRGRQLVIAGERRTETAEDRVYQQVEIDGGPFRRVVELGAEVAADRAEASYQDGILRVEIPLVRPVARTPRRIPIRPGGTG